MPNQDAIAYNTQIINGFWVFVEDNDHGMMVKRNTEGKIECIFDMSCFSIDQFMESYMDENEIVDAKLIGNGQIVIVLTDELLGLVGGDIDNDLVWSLRPDGLREEW